MIYDYVIVGSGLFGAVFAREAVRRGKSVLVLEKRDAVGGNVRTEQIENVQVHAYGAHIFHTSDREVWDYVNELVEFNRFTNAPVANYKGDLYNLPFNMNTFNRMWGVVTPKQAWEKIQSQRARVSGEITNLEEQAISLVGEDIYLKLIKGYTEKQWGKSCKELPAFIIKRLPVRLTYDNNYFNDRYQGIPIGGYTLLIEKLLKNCEVRLNADFNQNRAAYRAMGRKVVYTGMLDAYFDYRLGDLEYRSLRFETETLSEPNYQGVAVMNYTDRETPYTRIIEHKHFQFGEQPNTVITREYPEHYERGMEPYYPINDERNQKLYAQYAQLAQAEEHTIFGGRLAEYRYYDMDKIIFSALKAARAELEG